MEPVCSVEQREQGELLPGLRLALGKQTERGTEGDGRTARSPTRSAVVFEMTLRNLD